MIPHDPQEARSRASLPEAARRVAQELRKHGYIAFFAGGCVRDQLLGREPKDFDVATNATPEQVRQLFHKTQEVGAAFGVMLVRLLGRTIEVTTFRSEGTYSDARRPDTVTFADPETDARRRDFTINGLFQDPETGEIIDYVGGRADLEEGVIRAIGDPTARFREDRLRMLRAVRFAARFRFTIETHTFDSIRAYARELEGVSRERIGQEVKWMLTDPTRGRAAHLLQSLGLDANVLHEPSANSSTDLLEALGENFAYPAVLAAWRLVRTQDLFEIDALKAARAWSRALVLSNADEAGLAHTLIIMQRLLREWPGLRVAGQKRMAVEPWFDEALGILQCHAPESAALIRSRVAELTRTELAPPPLLTGDDLMAIGCKPGPIFRDLLDKVYDEQLEGRITDRESALAFVRIQSGLPPSDTPRK